VLAGFERKNLASKPSLGEEVGDIERFGAQLRHAVLPRRKPRVYNRVATHVRAAGSPFIGLTLFSSRVGIGLNPTKTVSKAKVSALYGLEERLNAAELINVRVTKYPRFYVAGVKLASRHIQECASVGLVDEAMFRATF